jgi:hypothetical protein
VVFLGVQVEDLKIKNEYVPKIVPPTPTPSYDSCTCVEMLLDPPLFSPPHEVEVKPCTTPSHLDPYHAFSLKGQLGMQAKDARDNHEPVSWVFSNYNEILGR